MTKEEFKLIWNKIPSECPVILMSERGWGHAAFLSSALNEDDKLFDMRLSQAVEGDLIGLPFLDESGQEVLRVPDYWFRNNVIFFDEFCRAHSTERDLLLKIVSNRKLFGIPDNCRIVIGVDNSFWNDFKPELINKFFLVPIENGPGVLFQMDAE